MDYREWNEMELSHHVQKIRCRQTEETRRWFTSAKCMYNVALYQARQKIIGAEKVRPFWNVIKEHLSPGEKKIFWRPHNWSAMSCNKQCAADDQPDFRSMPAKVSQGIVFKVEEALRSFRTKTNNWFKEGQVGGKPGLPKYKRPKRLGGQKAMSSFEIEFAPRWLKGNVLSPFKKHGDCPPIAFPQIYIPSFTHEVKNIASLRFVPEDGEFYWLEIIYKTYEEKPPKPQGGRRLLIDLGVCNLATILDDGALKAFVIKGGRLLSALCEYDRKVAKIQRKLDTEILTPLQRNNLMRLRTRITSRYNRRSYSFLHHASAAIVKYAKENGISEVTTGWNEGWKQEINIGKKNNRRFTMMPHGRFLDMLAGKLSKLGIDLHRTEESYTSKCDHLVLEPMSHQEVYLGKRIHRGLFRSSATWKGKRILINADVNGCLGIGRKRFGDTWMRTISSALLATGDSLCPKILAFG